MKRLVPLALSAALAVGLLGGCGTSSTDAAGDTMAVSASFYPLQWAAEQIGGNHVTVTGLTPPGGEPHDLELTPKAVAALSRAEVVVYLAHFQPAVDDAVTSQASGAALDVSGAADLSITATEDGHEHTTASAAPSSGGESTADPHFWLDPQRFEKVAEAIGARFEKVDPAHAADYRANTQALVAQLGTLDEEFRSGLATCRQKYLVTAHTAFAYLAQRYGFEQEGIAGINPDAEPDAATLRTLTQLVEEHGVSTVYTETLASPALAETVAAETGAKVAVLDPVEGLTDTSAGHDYLEVMRSNLATLREGQQCS